MMGVSIEAPWSLPCKAVVSAKPDARTDDLPAQMFGGYFRTVPEMCGYPYSEEVCYMSPDGSHRLVWGNQWMYSAMSSPIYLEGPEGITRQCSGWVLEAAVGARGSFEP